MLIIKYPICILHIVVLLHVLLHTFFIGIPYSYREIIKIKLRNFLTISIYLSI